MVFLTFGLLPPDSPPLPLTNVCSGALGPTTNSVIIVIALCYQHLFPSPLDWSTYQVCCDVFSLVWIMTLYRPFLLKSVSLFPLWEPTSFIAPGLARPIFVLDLGNQCATMYLTLLGHLTYRPASPYCLGVFPPMPSASFGIAPLDVFLCFVCNAIPPRSYALLAMYDFAHIAGPFHLIVVQHALITYWLVKADASSSFLPPSLSFLASSSPGFPCFLSAPWLWLLPFSPCSVALLFDFSVFFPALYASLLAQLLNIDMELALCRLMVFSLVIVA